MARMAQIVDGYVLNIVEVNELTDHSMFAGYLVPAGEDVAITDEYDSEAGVFSKVDVSVNLTPEEIAELMAPVPFAIVEE